MRVQGQVARTGKAIVGDPNMSVRHAARRAVQRVGLDVQRFPGSAPLFQVVRLMNRQGVTFVIDVGANIGQYASELRRLGFRNSILSLEPLRAEFEVLAQHCARDRSWSCQRLAVGGQPGEATINVAGNSVSSSLAPMLSRHLRAAPESRFVRTEEVRVTTIDDLAAAHGLDLATTFLKVDTQGFERHVLAGAANSLERLGGVQLELSLVPLYEDDLQLSSAIGLMEAVGLRLVAILPGFTDPVTFETLQCDGVFFRHTD
jgi:FkbM family methyltransferase